MTPKEKILFVTTCGGALLRIPLSMALTFLILRHINATDTMWLLFWLSLPIILVFTLITELTNNFLKEDTAAKK